MLLFLWFWDNVSDTFTYTLPLGTFNGDMLRRLSFLTYAELLPLLFIITFCHFQDFQHFFFITFWDSNKVALNYPILQFPNRVHTKLIFYVDFMWMQCISALKNSIGLQDPPFYENVSWATLLLPDGKWNILWNISWQLLNFHNLYNILRCT